MRILLSQSIPLIPARQGTVLADFALPSQGIGNHLAQSAHARSFSKTSLRLLSISAVAFGKDSDVPFAGFKVAVTSIFPWRNSGGSGKCSVPSASTSKIAVIVLMGGRYRP